MNKGCKCVAHDASLIDAAKMMAQEKVGALPICGPEDKLIGMLTDRDIVVSGLAEGKDPESCTAEELATGRLVWCYEDAPVNDILSQMHEHLVRRVPVISREDRKLVGIIAQADIARKLDHQDTGELVEAVSDAPAQQKAAF